MRNKGRNYRYRRRRRKTVRQRMLLLLGMLSVAALVAAAVVIAVLVFLPKEAPPAPEPGASQVGSMVSQPVSQPPAADLSGVNPNAGTAASEGELSYQSLYPELYVPIVEKIPVADGDKVVYLTYDDGPSEETPRLLDILDQEGVKATFFVMAQGKSLEQCKTWLKMIVDRGHAIGVHTYTHDYKSIYASVEAFLEDFKKMHDLIYEATGQKITMLRFAGGSVNQYNQSTCKAIVAEMERRGYTYFDWNVDSGDSERGKDGAFIYKTTVEETLSHQKSIVLMHNTKAKSATVDQTAAIIQKIKSAGYRFDVLDPSVKPFKFRLPE